MPRYHYAYRRCEHSISLPSSDVKYEIINVHALPRYSMPKSKNGNVYSDKFTLSVVELTHIDITAASQIPRFLNYAKKIRRRSVVILPQRADPPVSITDRGIFLFSLIYHLSQMQSLYQF